MPADRYYKLRSGIAKILKKHLGKDFWKINTSDITDDIEKLIINSNEITLQAGGTLPQTPKAIIAPRNLR